MTRRSAFIAAGFLGGILLLLVVGHLTNRFSMPPDLATGRTATGPNEVTIPLWDTGRGVCYLFKGFLKEGSQIPLGKDVEQRILNFGKGFVSIPLDPPAGSGPEGLNPPSPQAPVAFRLDFREARYEGIPGLTHAARIILPAPCVGVLDDGTTKTTIDFESLTVDLEGPGHLVLDSSRPVSIARDKPFLLLKGKAGLAGRFTQKENAHTLRFPAPVYGWLNRASGQSFLSLGGEPKEGGGGAGTGFLCIQCEKAGGGLILDGAANQITFDQRVVISPTAKLEVPAKVEPRRIECHRLVIWIDPRTKELARAEAERGPDAPVRGHYDTVSIESGKAAWDVKADAAELTGSPTPHLWGTTADMTFDATSDKILLDNKGRRARLTGPIASTITLTPSPEKQELPTAWVLDADYAEVLFSRGEKHQIAEVIASADPAVPSPRGVRFESRKGGAIVARGGKLAYAADTQTTTVTGLPNQPPYLEVDLEGPEVAPIAAKDIGSAIKDLTSLHLSAWATQVVFRFREGSIFLEEKVKARIVRTSEAAGELSDGLRAHKARIAAGRESKTMVLEAWAKDASEPLVLEYDGPPRVRLEGGHLDWDREKGLAHVLPHADISRQIISFLGGSLSCRELTFQVLEAVAKAHGEVEVEFQTQEGAFTLLSDEAELTIDPKAVSGHGPPSLASLRRLVASAAPGKLVSFRHDRAEATAGEITYDASKGAILLSGSDRQTFRYLGPAGPDEISAQNVKFTPADNRLVLSGAVGGTIHQQNWSDEAAALPGEKSPETPWTYKADSAELQLSRAGDSWSLASFTATGHIRLSNDDVQVVVDGDALHFNPVTRTIELGAEAGGGTIQTVRHGAPPQTSLLTARAMRIVRRDRLERQGVVRPEICAVLTKDVACHFYLLSLPGVKGVSAHAPDKFTVNADRLEVVIPATRAPTGFSVSFGRAQGNVLFRAFDEASDVSKQKPLYSGAGAEAVYHDSPFTFTIRGDGKGGVATVEHPLGSERAPQVRLQQRADGSFSVERSSGYDYQLPESLKGLPK